MRTKKMGFSMVEAMIVIAAIGIASLVGMQMIQSLGKGQKHMEIVNENNLLDNTLSLVMGSPVVCNGAFQKADGSPATFVPGVGSNDLNKIVFNKQVLLQVGAKSSDLTTLSFRLTDTGTPPEAIIPDPALGNADQRYVATLTYQMQKIAAAASYGGAAMRVKNVTVALLVKSAGNSIQSCASSGPSPRGICAGLGGNWLLPNGPCDMSGNNVVPSTGPLTFVPPAAPVPTPNAPGEKDLSPRDCMNTGGPGWKYDHCICPTGYMMVGHNADAPRPPGMLYRAECFCCRFVVLP